MLVFWSLPAIFKNNPRPQNVREMSLDDSGMHQSLGTPPPKDLKVNIMALKTSGYGFKC